MSWSILAVDVIEYDHQPNLGGGAVSGHTIALRREWVGALTHNLPNHARGNRVTVDEFNMGLGWLLERAMGGDQVALVFSGRTTVDRAGLHLHLSDSLADATDTITAAAISTRFLRRIARRKLTIVIQGEFPAITEQGLRRLNQSSHYAGLSLSLSLRGSTLAGAPTPSTSKWDASGFVMLNNLQPLFAERAYLDLFIEEYKRRLRERLCRSGRTTEEPTSPTLFSDAEIYERLKNMGYPFEIIDPLINDPPRLRDFRRNGVESKPAPRSPTPCLDCEIPVDEGAIPFAGPSGAPGSEMSDEGVEYVPALRIWGLFALNGNFIGQLVINTSGSTVFDYEPDLEYFNFGPATGGTLPPDFPDHFVLSSVLTTAERTVSFKPTNLWGAENVAFSTVGATTTVPSNGTWWKVKRLSPGGSWVNIAVRYYRQSSNSSSGSEVKWFADPAALTPDKFLPKGPLRFDVVAAPGSVTAYNEQVLRDEV